MSQSLVIIAFQCELVNPEETQEGEEHLPSSSHQAPAIPMVSHSGAQDVEKLRILDLDN